MCISEENVNRIETEDLHFECMIVEYRKLLFLKTWIDTPVMYADLPRKYYFHGSFCFLSCKHFSLFLPQGDNARKRRKKWEG